MGKDKIYWQKARDRNLERCRKNERLSQRRRRANNPELAREKDRIYRLKYKIKKDAVNKLNTAVASRKLIRPVSCSRCPAKDNIQGHHPDYSKPLQVIWLCPICHKAEHKNIHRLLTRTKDGL